MLRDALATPYTLGVSTGASLGAVVAIALGLAHRRRRAGHLGGRVGGRGRAFCSSSWAPRPASGRSSAFGLLLAGVAINSVCSALILLVHGLSGMSQSFAISRWLIGSLDAIEYPALFVFMAVVTVTAVVIIRQARQWNLLAVGEAWAAHARRRRARGSCSSGIRGRIGAGGRRPSR